jgi:hypothetical protein
MSTGMQNIYGQNRAYLSVSSRPHVPENWCNPACANLRSKPSELKSDVRQWSFELKTRGVSVSVSRAMEVEHSLRNST